jgi:hypothetical protein
VIQINELLTKKVNELIDTFDLEGSEKNTKYFANLEKKKAEQKIISQLKDNRNNIETNQNKILTKITYL